MGVSSQYVADSSSIADGAVSEAKLAAQACSAAKMKKEGTVGHVLTSNGAGSIPSYQAVGVAAQSFNLIETKTLSSAATNYEFTSFATGYKEFLLCYNIKAAGNAGVASIVLNSDTTANNYTAARFTQKNTTLAGLDTNPGNIPLNETALADNNYYVHGWARIQNGSTAAYKAFDVHSYLGVAWGVEHYLSVGQWKFNTDITSIKVQVASNNMDTGSLFTLYGLK